MSGATEQQDEAGGLARIHRTAAELQRHVYEGRYCALLGPRFTGKTRVLNAVHEQIRADGAMVSAYVNLHQLDAATQKSFFTSMAQAIDAEVAAVVESATVTARDLESGAVFRSYLTAVAAEIRHDLVIIIDHLEGVPNDLVQALLTSLRAVYMEQHGNPYQIISVVCGALSLATLAVGETSPFHGIARRVFMEDLSEEESAQLLDDYLKKAPTPATAGARERLLEATLGDPGLMTLITSRSLKAAAQTTSQRLSATIVKRVVRAFIDAEAGGYPPIEEAIRIIEDDPELLQCIVSLLKHGLMARRDLPLPLDPDLDPLYLTGIVSRPDPDHYTIQNGIYRRYLQRHFEPGRVGHVMMIAGRWNLAIDFLEDSIRAGDTSSIPDLLATTINSMYASENVKRAAYFLRRGLTIAFEIREAYIWHMPPDAAILRLLEQFDVNRRSPPAVQELPLDADLPETRALREARSLRRQEKNVLKLILPLLTPQNEAIGVVVIHEAADAASSVGQRERHLRLLGYLGQAARAIQDVSNRQRQNQRIEEQNRQLEEKARQLSLLHQVSTLVQKMTDLEKIFRLILSTVTASYGLRFNRAWLFLYDPRADRLCGRMAIGDYTREEAVKSWQQAEQVPFHELVEQLQRDEPLDPTPIDEPTRALNIPVSCDSKDVLSRVVYERHTFRWSTMSANDGPLPYEFQEAFVVKEAIITPLLSEKECLGVILVDDHFTSRFRSHVDEEILETFANQMAAAILSVRQKEQEKKQRLLAETMRDIATTFSGTLHGERVLELVLEQIERVLPFSSASVQRVNEGATALQIIAARGFGENTAEVETLHFPLDGDFPNALVWRERAPLRYADVRIDFPHFQDPAYHATHVRSWLGAPLMAGDNPIGVITVDGEQEGMYRQEHEDLLVTFAAEAAMAIENARLYAEVSDRVTELETLASVLHAIRTTVTTEPGDILRTIAEGACRVTGADCALIYPFLPDQMAYNPDSVVHFGLNQSFAPSHESRQVEGNLAMTVATEGTLVVEDVDQCEPGKLDDHGFIQREGIAAFVGASLRARDVPVGVLFVYFRQTRRFSQDDLETINRFADQAAVAILQAQLYRQTSEELQKKIREMEKLRKIDDAISHLNWQEVMHMVLESALELTSANSGTVQIVSDDGEELILEEVRGATLVSRGQRQPMGEGITGRAAVKGETIYIPDTRAPRWQDKHIPYIRGTRSELAVPMHHNGKIVGVINVESPDVDAFTGNDRRLVAQLAQGAAIAIHNAKQYRELKEAQDRLHAAGHLAWVGLFGTDWSHNIAQKTYSIRAYVDILRTYVDDEVELVATALEKIDALAQSIQDVPLVFPAPAEVDNAKPVAIDPLLQELVETWCESHEHVELELNLNCRDVLVRLDRLVFKMALQKLVDNALRHMPNRGRLTVASSLQENVVCIVLQDTGPGIPEEYQPLFGRQLIRHEGKDGGSGMGGLLAGFILRKFGGDLKLAWSRPQKGTRLELTLPAYNPQGG